MEYKTCRQSAKRVISSAKEKKQKEYASDLNDPKHQNEIFQMAKQMVQERQDTTGSNCLKGVSGKVTVHEKGIKDSWKEYMEKLTNEENEWDHGISAEVKERPADCIRVGEVVAALKKMKMHKAPGLSELSAEMIQATKGIATQWLLWTPYVIGQTIIFLPCGFFFLLLSFFPRLISAAADWMSTILPHMVWP